MFRGLFQNAANETRTTAIMIGKHDIVRSMPSRVLVTIEVGKSGTRYIGGVESERTQAQWETDHGNEGVRKPLWDLIYSLSFSPF